MTKTIKIINVFLILAVLGVLTLETRLLLTQAQDAPAGDGAAADEEADAPPTPEKDAGGECAAQIENYMIIRKIEFGQFMNEHFQSVKPTSELIPAAIEKYREYRADVLNKIENFVPKGGKLATSANAERAGCKKAVKEDFRFMSDLIRQHIIENAYAKKSTRLIDKYKVINGKLEKLNFTIAQTYGYFAALAQKLPCYAKQCTGH
ncbi:hypothetical protein HYW83_01525 [Candidatus Peregrinibacteria bacterium]|nr:hypothetical protein [Candidatus Peregrinibacteria bacterium]